MNKNNFENDPALFLEHVTELLDSESDETSLAKPALRVHFGKPDTTELKNVRASMPENDFLLFIFYSAPDKKIFAELESAVKPGERTLFARLGSDNVYLERFSILLTMLRPDGFNVAVSAEESMQETFSAHIAELKKSARIILSDIKNEKQTRLLYLRSSIQNLPRIIDRAVSLPPKIFAGKKALICCAGPSLRTQMELLKKYSSRVCLISIGRAAMQLVEAGIRPDIIVEIDAQARLNWTDGPVLDIPLAAIPIVSPSVSGRFSNIYWFSEPGSCFKGILDLLGIELDFLEVSSSVVTAAVNLALKLGCSEIALTGSDLSVTESGNTHVAASEKDSFWTEKLFKVEGKDGGEVLTTSHFNGLREILGAFFGVKKRSGAKIYNCTPGGALINNLTNMKLEDFCDNTSVFKKKTRVKSLKTDHTGALSVLTKILETFSAYNDTICEMASTACAIYNELSSAETDQEEIKRLRTELNELSETESILGNQESLTFIMSTVFAHVEEELSESPAVRAMKSNPLGQIAYFVKRYTMIAYTCNDIYRDLSSAMAEMRGEKKSPEYRRPFIFESFRKNAIDFVRKSNPAFARALFNGGDFDEKEFTFRTMPNWQYIPYVNVYRQDGTLIKLNDEVLLEAEAREEIKRFVSENSYRPDSDTVIFPAPGNWAYATEFAKCFPDSSCMIVETWPQLFSEIIKYASFTHYFPSDTIVAAVDSGLGNWKEIVEKNLQRWSSQGKRILFFKHPRTWRMKEVRALCSQLEKIAEVVNSGPQNN